MTHYELAEKAGAKITSTSDDNGTGLWATFHTFEFSDIQLRHLIRLAGEEAYDKGCSDGIDITKAQIEAAVLDERERCKAVLMAAHELSKQHHNYYHYMALQLDETAKATAIRARGAKCL